eukprot:sb/3466112/
MSFNVPGTLKSDVYIWDMDIKFTQAPPDCAILAVRRGRSYNKLYETEQLIPAAAELRHDEPPAPPAKPGMAFQITFDEPKADSPRRPGKKKRSSPPKASTPVDSNRVTEPVEKRNGCDKQSDRGSDKQSDKQSDRGSDKQSNGGSDRGSDKLSDKLSEKLSEKFSDKQSDKISDKASDKIVRGRQEPANQNSLFRSRDWLAANQDQHFLIRSVPGESVVLNGVTKSHEKEHEVESPAVSEKSEELSMEDPAVKKELTQWANSLLRRKDYVPVFSIHDALKDGRTLGQLLHCITDEKVSDLNKDPRMRVEILPNIDKCLQFSKNKHMMIGDVASRDIRGETITNRNRPNRWSLIGC